MGVLSKVEHKGKVLGGQGRGVGWAVNHRAVESYQELTFTCDLVGCYLGCAFPCGASVSSRPPQATWPKMDVEAAMLWRNLAKVSTEGNLLYSVYRFKC